MFSFKQSFTAMSRAWEVFSRPQDLFAELLAFSNRGPAWAALFLTSALFSLSSVVSYYGSIPFSEKPLWPHPAYRLLQAAAMPLILGLGCLLCCGLAAGLGRLLGAQTRFKNLWMVVLPAVLVPTWMMLWPTEMAVSLGLLAPDLKGFPGFWVRELSPALTLLYMLFLLSLALWQVFNRTWRESFALAFFALIPTLGFWALVLR